MKRKHHIALTVALAVLLLASIACSCGGGPKPLTARGGGCSDVYCYSLYGEGIGTSRDAAYNQAVGQLNAATQRNNRCGGSGLRIVKEQTLSGSYFVKVKVYSTVDCNAPAPPTPEERAAYRHREFKYFALSVLVYLTLNTFLFFTWRDFCETAYKFARKSAEEGGRHGLAAIPEVILWWLFWLPLTRTGTFFIIILILAFTFGILTG